ncbi:PepSY domain-containing protein [Domibacillus robiginosus]|uniref:PepSY domain-containing protein n=1 Tax=Domibacillus robiginosus TaxID=1071054 RepID=UPI00067AB57C|nr:PepSY domain-containing protein [Domibacillus robiginosus]
MKKIIMAVTVAAAIAAAVFLYQSFQKPAVKIAEAGEKLAEQYGGTVKESTQSGKEFHYTIAVPEQGEYSMTVDSETGELMAVTRLKAEAAKKPEEQTSETEENNGQLTPEEAEKIALTKVPGTVDDIEQGDEEEAGSYLVDINAQNGEEATVRINAISGEVLSISWDD